LSDDELLYKIVEAVYSFSENELNHVLFVTRGRFTDEERKSYKLFKKLLPNINEFTTIVRTGFPGFENKKKREEDKNANPKLNEVVKDCNGRIIHVNNLTREEDSELDKRRKCRNVLLSHLKDNCSKTYVRNISSTEVSSKFKSLKTFIASKKEIRDKIITDKNNLKR